MSPDLLTTAQIAEHHGYTIGRVHQIAAARHITPAMLVGRAKLWRTSDLPRFASRPTGRPKQSSQEKAK